jgi:hypothetical protein
VIILLAGNFAFRFRLGLSIVENTEKAAING